MVCLRTVHRVVLLAAARDSALLSIELLRYPINAYIKTGAEGVVTSDDVRVIRVIINGTAC